MVVNGVGSVQEVTVDRVDIASGSSYGIEANASTGGQATVTVNGAENTVAVRVNDSLLGGIHANTDNGTATVTVKAGDVEGGSLEAIYANSSGGTDFLAALLESQGPGMFDSSVSDAAIVVLQLVFEDGTGGAAVLSVAQNKPFAMPGAPEREGFRFLGWQAEIDGETVTFAPGERVTLREAVTFRALWEPDNTASEADMNLGLRE